MATADEPFSTKTPRNMPRCVGVDHASAIASSPARSHSLSSLQYFVLAGKGFSLFPPAVAPPVEGKREKDMEKMIRGCICLFKEKQVFMSLHQLCS